MPKKFPKSIPTNGAVGGVYKSPKSQATLKGFGASATALVTLVVVGAVLNKADIQPEKIQSTLDAINRAANPNDETGLVCTNALGERTSMPPAQVRAQQQTLRKDAKTGDLSCSTEAIAPAPHKELTPKQRQDKAAQDKAGVLVQRHYSLLAHSLS